MRLIFATLCAILLLGLMACGNEGPVWSDTQPGPVTPPPVTNPGGPTYQLQVTIDLSKTSGRAPLPINMIADTIGGQPPFIYRWDVNGDQRWDYEGTQFREVGVQYASAGLYYITVEVEDSLGTSFRAYAQVEVKPSGPIAIAMAIPDKGTAPFPCKLDGSLSVDSDGEIVLWEWDQESDGVWDYESDEDPSVVVDYLEPGTFNATLRVTDDDGLTAVTSVQIIAF